VENTKLIINGEEMELVALCLFYDAGCISCRSEQYPMRHFVL
jgi:hypothetical protein